MELGSIEIPYLVTLVDALRCLPCRKELLRTTPGIILFRLHDATCCVFLASFPHFLVETILQVRWGMLSSKLLYCSHTFGVFYHQPTHNLPLLWWAWHKRAFNPLFEQRGLIGFAILPEQDDSSTMSPDGARALGKEEMIPRLEYHNAGKLYLRFLSLSNS